MYNITKRNKNLASDDGGGGDGVNADDEDDDARYIAGIIIYANMQTRAACTYIYL